jgi:NAD(P)-dependent dehydrogenase (short-subunit alcohol dehydrogenase family)
MSAVENGEEVGRNLQGIVLITGAAQGIGECVARTCAARGATVFLADIQAERVRAVADELGARSCEVDVADPSSARRMVDAALHAHQHVDALVNIAGIDAPFARAASIGEDHWRRLIDVDLSGPWWCVRAALPAMIARGRGRIINVASVCGVVPCPGVSVAYAAAKSGVIGLTMALAAEVESEGILVNAIAPGGTGNTGTPMTDAQRDEYLATHALGFGGPEPIAEAVVHLLGSGGDWMSGAVLNVSGGYWHGR